MSQTAKEHRRRERLREYEAALDTARSVLAVLARFARGRQRRAQGESLEEAFAATVSDTLPVPAAVWVALRQDDVDAALDVLLALSSTEFVVADHEQLDGDYRLVSVAESQPLPELERLTSQLSAFLQIPVDVVAMVAGWGADDPRTAAEIDALLDQRFGPARVAAAPAPAPAPLEAPAPVRRPAPAAPRGGLTMSDDEFSALLALSADQRRVLATLVRQATVTITTLT